MNEVAVDLLRRLLASAERVSKRRPVLPITRGRAPEYFGLNDRGDREPVLANLEQVEAIGAVRLEWLREGSRDLERIRLKDADRLAAYLGQERAGDKAARIEGRVGPLMTTAPDWLREAWNEAVGKWRRGETAFSFSADQGDQIEQLFRLALGVSRGVHEGQPPRRFSAEQVGDPKALERLQGRLAFLLRRDPRLADLESGEDVFRTLGLDRTPPPLFLRGAVEIRGNSGWQSLAPYRPFVALDPGAIHEVKLLETPSYLLSIETLDGFQRQVRDVDDRGLVIWVGGVPGPGCRRLLARLDQVLPAEVPAFHWGNSTLAGIRALAKLSQAFQCHPLRPHLMNGSRDPEARPFGPQERQGLEKLVEEGGVAGQLAARWLEQASRPEEQEQQDPRAPLLS